MVGMCKEVVFGFGSRACFTLVSLLDFSVPVDFCKVIQAAIE